MKVFIRGPFFFFFSPFVIKAFITDYNFIQYFTCQKGFLNVLLNSIWVFNKDKKRESFLRQSSTKFKHFAEEESLMKRGTKLRKKLCRKWRKRRGREWSNTSKMRSRRREPRNSLINTSNSNALTVAFRNLLTLKVLFSCCLVIFFLLIIWTKIYLLYEPKNTFFILVINNQKICFSKIYYF